MSLWLTVHVYCGMNIFHSTQMGYRQLCKDCKHTAGIPLPLAPRGYDCQLRAVTGNTSPALECCCRRKVQEGRIRQSHTSPGISTPHSSNWAYVGLNHAAGQMLPTPAGTHRLWPELRNCPNMPKGKKQGFKLSKSLCGLRTVWSNSLKAWMLLSFSVVSFNTLLLCMLHGL